MERVSRNRSVTQLAPPSAPAADEPRIVSDDHWHTPKIKRHSLVKIRVHNRVAAMFATAMSPKWKQLAYIGLYSGSGRAEIEGTGQIVETSALAVLRQPTPFTHYIYVDNDHDCTQSLDVRAKLVALSLSTAPSIKVIEDDVNASIPNVLSALPSYSRTNGLLSFCFVDPFDTSLNFNTLRQLSARKVDLLILLMLGFDANLNFRQYFKDERSTRIADLIDCPNWREEFKREGRPVKFVLRKFDEAMQRIGYLGTTPEDIVSVKVHGKSVMVYKLAYYSQHEAGKTLFRNAVKSLTPKTSQMALEF